MSHSHKEECFSDDLQEVADVLRDQRPALTPLELDRVKLRAMSGARRSTSSPQKGFFMRSRMTMLLTAGLLALGSGGALALTGGFGGQAGGSASFSQYRNCEHGKGKGQGRCHEREEHGHGHGH
jgi:hypothetical protein